MKKIILVIGLFLISFNVFSQEKEIVEFNYNQDKGILSNKDYNLACTKFVHLTDGVEVNEKKYLAGLKYYTDYRDIKIKKYIIVKDLKTNLYHAVEYWVREDKSVLVLLIKLNNNS